MPSLAGVSLRARLLPIVAAALVPALGFIVYSGWAESRELRAQGLESALRLARSFIVEPEGAIDEAYETLASLMAEADTSRGAAAACARFTPALLQQHPSFDQLGVLSPDGAVACSSRPLAGLVPPKTGFPPERFAVARLDVGGQSILACLHPVRNAAGAVGAVGFATLDLPRLGALVAKLDLPAGSFAALLGRSGEVLLQHPPGAPGRAHATSAVAPDLDRAAGEGTARSRDADGRWRLYGFTPLHGPGNGDLGFAYVAVPEDAVLAPVRRAVQRNVLGLTLAALLATGVLWASSGAFVLDTVQALVRASRELAAGRLSARSGARTGAGELRQLARAFDEMAESLERSVTDTRRALDALGQSRARLQGLSHWLIQTQEAERRHIARELHDEIGQALTAVTLQLGHLRRHAPGPEAGAGAPQLDSTADVVRQAIERVRGLSLELRPAMLDDLGLVPALRWYCDRQVERSGLPIALHATDVVPRPTSDVETACFRIVQEALTNVVRHASAGRAEVEVGVEGRNLRCVVRDDGRGFDVEAVRLRARGGGAFGLLGMEERAVLLGGDFAVESRPGAGTTIRVHIPLEAPPKTA